MSVLKRNRGESTVQFLENAIKLEVYSIKQCMKFPKRYTFVLSNRIVELARECLINVKAANSIYAKSEHEKQIRRDYFLKAYTCVTNLYTQLDIAKECGIEINEHVMKEWSGLIYEEERLLRGILKKEK